MNVLDIIYSAVLNQTNSANLIVLKNGTLFYEEKITENTYSKLFRNIDNKEITTGHYDFILSWRTPANTDTSITSSIFMPYYPPTQKVTIKNIYDIEYMSNLRQEREATLHVLKDDNLIYETIITEQTYSYIFSNIDNKEITTGNYNFILSWRTPANTDTLITASIFMPYYPPTQTVTIKNIYDIEYIANLHQESEAILHIIKNNELIYETIITEQTYSHLFSNIDNKEITTGNYDFILSWITPANTDTSIIESIFIPYYPPTHRVNIKDNSDIEYTVNLHQESKATLHVSKDNPSLPILMRQNHVL